MPKLLLELLGIERVLWAQVEAADLHRELQLGQADGGDDGWAANPSLFRAEARLREVNVRLRALAPCRVALLEGLDVARRVCRARERLVVMGDPGYEEEQRRLSESDAVGGGSSSSSEAGAASARRDGGAEGRVRAVLAEVSGARALVVLIVLPFRSFAGQAAHHHLSPRVGWIYAGVCAGGGG